MFKWLNLKNQYFLYSIQEIKIYFQCRYRCGNCRLRFGRDPTRVSVDVGGVGAVVTCGTLVGGALVVFVGTVVAGGVMAGRRALVGP